MASEIRVDRIRSTAGGAVVNATVNNDGSITFGGNVDITGNLLQNGAPFAALPEQVPAGQEGTTQGATLKSDGVNAYWELIIDFADGFAITRGYPAAGYQSGNAWRNVNRCQHSTFSISNLGDLIDRSDAYTAGAQNTAMKAFIYCTGNNWNTDSNYVSTFSMATESNTGASTTMATSRNRTSIMKRDFRYAYVCGNNNDSPDRFDLVTDAVATVGGSGGSGGNNPACGYGETNGMYKQGGNAYLFQWATESWSGWGSAPGTDGTNKTLSSRRGFSYWNTAGGYQTNAAMSRRDIQTGTNQASVGKPGTTGEETFHTGVDYGFMNGMYNGAQNNTGGYFTFSTHSFSFQSSLNRQGPGGTASGAAMEYGTLATGYTGV